MPEQQRARAYAEDDLLTMRQAAGVMRISYFTLSRWAARGEFCPGAAIKLPNGHWRVCYRDLMDWLLSRAPDATGTIPEWKPRRTRR